jgi:hypothetical protein
MLATLLDLAAAGRRVVLVTLAEEPPSQLMGNVIVYHLPHLVDDIIRPIEIKASPNLASAAPVAATRLPA